MLFGELMGGAGTPHPSATLQTLNSRNPFTRGAFVMSNNVKLESASLANHEVLLTPSDAAGNGRVAFVPHETTRTIPIAGIIADRKAIASCESRIRRLKIALFLFKVRLYSSYSIFYCANLVSVVLRKRVSRS
jgi:hypothetical protein